MTSAVQLVSASNGRALWYLTRSTGVVALLLLTATVVLGVVASVGWTAERWPRFLSQTVHRNLSLLCLAFVGVHIVTTVSDGYVPIGFVDAFLPLHSPYRPVWIGLGALAFDLLLAVLVTSALRQHIRYPAWRFVHWLAYLCWPIAMFHALGSGSDSSLPVVLGIDALCGAAVLLSIVWRAITGRQFRLSKRVAASIGAVVMVIALVVFAALGPLRPGWSHRSGTSAALLAQIARNNAVGTSSIGSVGAPANVGPAATPAVPFSYAVTGTQSETSPDRQGSTQVIITLHLNDASSPTLVITLNGSALQSGGLILSSGTVDFGGLRGIGQRIEGGDDHGSADFTDSSGTDRIPFSRWAHGSDLRDGDRCCADRRRERPVRAGPLAGSAGPDGGRVYPVGIAPPGTARLLGAPGVPGRAVGLGEHLDRWGPPPVGHGPALIDEIARSGLRGRGGGWFPVGTKWRSVRRNGLRHPVVVANASEGEPASRKDHFLVTQQPHLVLDGAMLAAAAVGASQVVVHVSRSGLAVMTGAIEERGRRRLDSCEIDLVVASDRYLAGQESALVNTINGLKPDTPGFVALRPVRDRGVGGRPTLVQNVETLAHASLIARFGADWFRGAGTAESPGTTLLTVSGHWPEPRIVEATLGLPLGHTLGLSADASSSIQGALLGGYGGGWIRSAEALSMPFTEEMARQNGSSIGAGVVVLLPKHLCPLLEVSRVVRYLQGEGAGQCGPCVNGLASLATTMETLAAEPSRLRHGVSGIPALCRLVEGRGACAHPDGVARFVRSALDVFGEHVALHLRRGPCHTTAPPFLPIPHRRSRS